MTIPDAPNISPEPRGYRMAVAWRDCLMWAAGEQEIRDAFESDTDMRLPITPFDTMIDQATGFDKALAEAFVRWFNENIWGQAEAAP